MGTPAQELESKYFIEGKVRARSGHWKEILIYGTIVREEHATRILLFASWSVNRLLNLQFARGGGGP